MKSVPSTFGQLADELKAIPRNACYFEHETRAGQELCPLKARSLVCGHGTDLQLLNAIGTLLRGRVIDLVEATQMRFVLNHLDDKLLTLDADADSEYSLSGRPSEATKQEQHDILQTKAHLVDKLIELLEKTPDASAIVV